MKVDKKKLGFEATPRQQKRARCAIDISNTSSGKSQKSYMYFALPHNPRTNLMHPISLSCVGLQSLGTYKLGRNAGGLQVIFAAACYL